MANALGNETATDFYQSNATELQQDGITIIPDYYTYEQCHSYKQLSEKLFAERLASGRGFNHDCPYINSPFRHNEKFFDLLDNEPVEQILGKVLDPDFVLINTNIINRRSYKDLPPSDNTGIGMNWHTDSRYLGGKRMQAGLSFIVIIMFDDFTAHNAPTMYVPKSHLRYDRPERHADYPHKTVTGKAGTIVIYDSGIWHRGSPSTPNDRWGLFSLYGPWFMKPYYRFTEMLGEDKMNSLSPRLQRLLHNYSTPPINDDDREYTITKSFS